MAKAIYTPLGVIFGVIGGIVGGAIFKQVWKQITGRDDAPSARESEYTWAEVLPAAAVQGAIFAVVKAAVDRGGARGFQKLTGVWPGD